MSHINLTVDQTFSAIYVVRCNAFWHRLIWLEEDELNGYQRTCTICFWNEDFASVIVILLITYSSQCILSPQKQSEDIIFMAAFKNPLPRHSHKGFVPWKHSWCARRSKSALTNLVWKAARIFLRRKLLRSMPSTKTTNIDLGSDLGEVVDGQ